jgi:hypothetical protein
MKHFTFSLLICLLSFADGLMAQTATSNDFHHSFMAMQNHLPAYNGAQSITFKPNLPCLIVGGYSVTASGTKTVWGIHQPSTYARWDTLATIEAKNGALRFIEKGWLTLTDDVLFMPGSYVMDWVKLAGYPLPSSMQSFGLSVIVFDPTNIK